MADLAAFPLVSLGPNEERLRADVRQFLRERLPTGFRPGLGMGGRWDPEFSQALAERGWVGMAIPTDYGGSARSAVERFVVTEELLAAGAPVAAHWVADRQSAPMILHHGTEDQRRRFLPAIATGTCYFSIGMSEPDAGSDLASVRSSATKVDGGWRLNGTKVWTSHAHRSHYLVVLCRTAPPADGDRHRGLSQLIVDLSSPGVSVHPIRFLDGSQEFNEVVLDDVFVPDGTVLGEPGAGWSQVTSELVLERGGPDRFLSAFVLLRHYLAWRSGNPDPHYLAALGRLVAGLWTIHQLGLSVAHMIDRGDANPMAASVVKDLGTQHEQLVVEVLSELTALDPDPLGKRCVREPAGGGRGCRAVVHHPGRDDRGAPGRDSPRVEGMTRSEVSEVEALTARIVADRWTNGDDRREEGWPEGTWRALADAGLPWVGVDDAAGGSGGTLADACDVLWPLGAAAVPLPVAETGILASWVLAAAGLEVPDGPTTIAMGSARDHLHHRKGRWHLTARLERVAWAERAALIVVVCGSDNGDQVVVLRPEDRTVVPGRNLAGEPRDQVIVDTLLRDDQVVPLPGGIDRSAIRQRGALSRAVLMAGAMERIAALTVGYGNDRAQFGKPIISFQAVANLVVQVVEHSLAAGAAARAAVAAGDEGAFEVAVAKQQTSALAGTIAKLAHQAHGAIGMTAEYELAGLTRRTHSAPRRFRCCLRRRLRASRRTPGGRPGGAGRCRDGPREVRPLCRASGRHRQHLRRGWHLVGRLLRRDRSGDPRGRGPAPAEPRHSRTGPRRGGEPARPDGRRRAAGERRGDRTRLR